MQVAGIVLGSACSVNGETDAVIPWDLSLTNTTNGFSLSSGDVQLYLSEGNSATPASHSYISYEFRAGGSPTCADQRTFLNGGSFMAGWGIDVPPQQSITLGGYVIISNYYSPAHPNGNTSKLANAHIVVMVASNPATEDTKFKAGTNMTLTPSSIFFPGGFPQLAVPQ